LSSPYSRLNRDYKIANNFAIVSDEWMSYAKLCEKMEHLEMKQQFQKSLIKAWR